MLLLTKASHATIYCHLVSSNFLIACAEDRKQPVGSVIRIMLASCEVNADLLSFIIAKANPLTNMSNFSSYYYNSSDSHGSENSKYFMFRRNSSTIEIEASLSLE